MKRKHFEWIFNAWSVAALLLGLLNLIAVIQGESHPKLMAAMFFLFLAAFPIKIAATSLVETEEIFK